MLAGSTADRVGRKRIFRLGLLLFSLGSLLCALAPTQGVLIAARVLQAIGGSMLSPVAMSIIRTVFVDPAERARAIGVLRGDVRAQHRARACARRRVGRRGRLAGRLPGQRACRPAGDLCHPPVRARVARRTAAGSTPLVRCSSSSAWHRSPTAPSRGPPRRAWTEIVASLALAALAFAVFIPYELRRREPLLEVRWFRSAPFSGASAIALCAFAALGAFLFLNTLYLQDVRGLSPLVPACACCRWRQWC